MLYLPDLHAGMSAVQAESAVRGQTSSTKPAEGLEGGSVGGGTFQSQRATACEQADME